MILEPSLDADAENLPIKVQGHEDISEKESSISLPEAATIPEGSDTKILEPSSPEDAENLPSKQHGHADISEPILEESSISLLEAATVPEGSDKKMISLLEAATIPEGSDKKMISLLEAATVPEGSDKKILEPSGEEDAEDWCMISMESLISLPEAATVSEGSDKKIPEPSGEEDAEEWFMISTSSATVPEGSEEDEIHLHTTPRGSNIFSESVDTGTQLPEEELELGSAIGRRPVVSGTHTKVGEKMGTFLFEVLVTPGNVKLNKLLIPVEAALKCFSPPAECQETYKKKIKTSDPQNFDWPMTLRYDPSECFFILENEWQIFAISNNVKSLDKIRFCKPVPRSDINHYLVETVKRRYPNAIHEFELENFMFQLPLTDMDIQHQRLIIRPQDVFKHFSAVGIPARTHDIERLYFSDDLNVHFWDIKIGYYHDFYHLMLADFFT